MIGIDQCNHFYVDGYIHAHTGIVVDRIKWNQLKSSQEFALYNQIVSSQHAVYERTTTYSQTVCISA